MTRVSLGLRTIGWSVVIIMLLPGIECAAQEASDFKDPDKRSLWLHFKDSPNTIDICALKLVHKIKFDTARDWPDLCNYFRDTDVLKNRVKKLKEALESLDLTEKQKQSLKKGKIWIGATKIMAELAWGRPQKINKTTTAARVREQWVYESSNYLYFVNGKLTSIQN